MEYDIFVSYGRDDADAARSLRTALAQRGNQVWLGGAELRPGERSSDTIRGRLHEADVVILLIGKEPDRDVRNEWSLVLQDSYSRTEPVRLVPLLMPGAELPSFVDVQAIRVDDEPIAWDRIAQEIEASEKPSFEWTTTDRARSELSHRLDQVEKLARTLPSDIDDVS
jgi:TIR domain